MDNVQNCDSYRCNPTEWIQAVRRQRREHDHSPTSGAEIKNGGAIPPLPHMPARRGVWKIKRNENFIFSLSLWSRALLEKQPVVEPLVKFSTFYGTRRVFFCFYLFEL
jgi:hypothetical protein